MAWSHDCIEGWNVYFLFEESFPFKLFNRTTIENLLYKPKKVNKTPLIVTPKKSFVSQSQHLFSARGMSSTRAGLPRYIKTPVIPNWISPHVDSTVQQAAVFGPHIGILLDSFALLLLSMHCSASLHKSESKSEAKRMSHCSPSLIWSRGAYACWWMLVGEVLGTSGWSGLEASKPGSSVPADDRSPAWTGREGGSNWRLSTTHRCGFYYTLWLALLNHAYMHIAHYWGFCRQCYEDSTTKNSKTHFWLHYWTKQKHTAHNIGAFIDNDTERTS